MQIRKEWQREQEDSAASAQKTETVYTLGL